MVPNNLNGTIYSLWALNDTMVLGAGSSGAYWMSTPELDSFYVADDYGTKDFNAIEFKNEVGIFVADGGLIYKTNINEYDTLYQVFTSPSGDDILDVAFINEFLVYGEEGSTIDENFVIDPTGGSDEDAFSLYNPDFNYKALIGSAVLRWEFRRGSTLYLVWTRNGSDNQNPGNFSFNRDLENLLSADADNVFALKVTYWFGK